MFWSRKQAPKGKERLSGARGIPGPVGSYMVVQMKKDPDWVWGLKGVVRPAGEKKTFYCRVFNEAQAAQAGFKVRDWASLDDHPALILWEGYFDEKQTRCAMKSLSKNQTPLGKGYWRWE